MIPHRLRRIVPALVLIVSFVPTRSGRAADDRAAAPTTAPGAAATFAPNENLVTDGIPTIPASIAEEAGRFTEFRAARA